MLNIDFISDVQIRDELVSDMKILDIVLDLVVEVDDVIGYFETGPLRP